MEDEIRAKLAKLQLVQAQLAVEQTKKCLHIRVLDKNLDDNTKLAANLTNCVSESDDSRYLYVDNIIELETINQSLARYCAIPYNKCDKAGRVWLSLNNWLARITVEKPEMVLQVLLSAMANEKEEKAVFQALLRVIDRTEIEMIVCAASLNGGEAFAPQGYLQLLNEKGRIYYIDHLNKKTFFERPDSRK